MSTSKIFDIFDGEDIDETNVELVNSKEKSLQPFHHADKKQNDILLYILVVGFHHKKGCVIDFCYPSLKCDNSSLKDENKSDDIDKLSSPDDFNYVEIPEQWEYLPSLAMPDGAHNYSSDIVFFHLPSLENPKQTVFAVACYRQIPTKELCVRTPDMVRSSVQKSVVAIFRAPFYGLVAQKLRYITYDYFRKLDFSQTMILEKSFYESFSFDPNLLQNESIFVGLSIKSVLSKFGKDLIVLFKLFLLERKVLFIMSPMQELCTTILAICSLFPGLLQEGMFQTHLPFELQKIISKQNEQNMGSMKKNEEKSNQVSTLLNKIENQSDKLEYSFSGKESELVAKLDENVVDKDFILLGQENENLNNCPPKLLNDIFHNSYHHYGLPLQLFQCNSYCLPYCSLSCYECLINHRVRSFIAGSSNIIIQQWKNDIEVFVTDDRIIFKNPVLKQILAPTVEDLRFMTFLMNASNLSSDTSEDQMKYSQYYNEKQFICDNDENITVLERGNDAWSRFHFKNYLLHLLRCSLLDETSKEYRSFNPSFMSEWKNTYNYKHWHVNRDIRKLFEKEIDPQHPFTANLINNIQFMIKNFLNDRCVEINQASKTMYNNAKSTFSSWINSLETYGPVQQTRSLFSRSLQLTNQLIESSDNDLNPLTSSSSSSSLVSLYDNCDNLSEKELSLYSKNVKGDKLQKFAQTKEKESNTTVSTEDLFSDNDDEINDKVEEKETSV